MPGQIKRIVLMQIDATNVANADRVTSDDCFLAKLVVSDLYQIEKVIDRFLPFSSTDTAITQSSTFSRRFPQLKNDLHSAKDMSLTRTARNQSTLAPQRSKLR
jgi:Lrp/AsnC family transcriptional regulator, leucine-responsive regulatory protein